MAKPGQSFENPLYSDTGGSYASDMSPYAFLNPAAASGSDALQKGLTDIATIGQMGRQAAQLTANRFTMPEVKRPPAIAYSPSQKKLFVNGITFDEDDADMTLRAEALLDKPPVGLPTGGDWRPLTPQTYGEITRDIRNPRIGELMSKNFGIGVDQLQMLAGRGLQFLGAEQLGQSIVDRQLGAEGIRGDLEKTAPYQRQFSEIDSAGSAIDWLAATVAQQGPNILGSIATAGAGYLLGGTAAATGLAGGALPKLGQWLSSTAGKKQFADKVQTELGKRALGQAYDEAFLRKASGLAAATIASVGQNYSLGVADIYGEFREQGTGADDMGARLAALSGAVPYAALESLPEFLLASRLFGVGGLSARGGATALKDIQGTNLLTTGVKRSGELLKRGFKGGVFGGTAEGTTELGQESLLLGLTGQDFSSPENINRLIESFAAGFGVGGTIGAAANLRRGPITRQPEDLLNPGKNPDPTPSESRVITPAGEPTPAGGMGFRPDFVAGEQGVRPSTPGDRIYTGAVEPNQFGGAQGVLDLGGIPVAEAKARSMQTGAARMPQVWDITTQSWRDVTPEEQAAQIGPQDLRADPNQLALQFAPPAPGGVGFTDQAAPIVNPVMQQQMNLAQSRQAQEQAAQQAAAQREADLNRLAVQAQNQRQLDLVQESQQQPAAPMPMRPLPIRQPQHLPLFNRRQAPVPSRAEGLRRGVGTQIQPAEPAPIAPPTPGEFQRAGQLSLFTQQGQPTVAALRSAAKPTPVATPTVQAGATQAAPTGAVVTPTTKAKAAKTLKRGSGTVNYEDGSVYTGQLKDGVPHGQGSMTYEDGSTYTGKFKDGVIHGQGRFEDADGTVMDGKFVDGEFQGEVQNAVQEQGAAEIPVQPRAKTGKEVGEKVRRAKEPAGKGQALKQGKAETKVTETPPDETPPPKGGKALKKAPAKKTEAKGKAAPKAAQLQKGPSGIAAMVGQLVGTTTQPAVVESETKAAPQTSTETQIANEEMDMAIETAETTKDAAAYAEALYEIVSAYALESNARKYTLKRATEFLADGGVPKSDFITALREVALDYGTINPRSKLYALLADHGLLNDANIAKLVRKPGAATTQEQVAGEEIGKTTELVSAEQRLANFIDSNPQWPNKKQLVAKLKKMFAEVEDTEFRVGSRGTIADFFDTKGNPYVTQPPGTSYFIPNTVAEEEVSKEAFVEKHNKAREDLRALEDTETQTTLSDIQFDPFYDRKPDSDDNWRAYRADGKPVAPMKAGALRLFVARVISKYARKPNVSVFANLAEMKRQNPALFEAAAKARKNGDIEAVNAAAMAWGNNVVLFSDFINTEEHARFIIAHETLGHVGFRGLFSSQALDKILQFIVDSDPQLRHEAEVYAQGKGIPFLEAVEEVLADRAAAVDTNTILRFWNWLKDQLNKLGLTFQDDAARYLIGISRKYVRQGVGRSEVNTSGLFKEITQALGNEQSDVEVLRFAQSVAQGSAFFAQNYTNRNFAIYGGIERSIRDIVEASQKAAEMRKQGKGVLRNIQNISQKVLDGIQTQDNMARKSKGYFKAFQMLQNQSARQTEYKTRYSEMTKLAHEAKFMGFGEGMTREETLRAGELMAYASLFKMNKVTDSQLAKMDNPMYYDPESFDDPQVNAEAFEALKALGMMTPEDFRKGFQVQQGYEERPMTAEYKAQLAADRDKDVADLEAARTKTLTRLNKKLAEVTDEEAKLKLQLDIKRAETKYARNIENTKRAYTKRMAETTYEAPKMVDVPAWFKDLKDDAIEYKVYRQFMDAIAQSNMDVLRGKYLGAIYETRRAITAGIDGAFKDALTAQERKFVEDIVNIYDKMRLADSKYKDNRLSLSKESEEDALEWLNYKFGRSFYTDEALNDLVKQVDGYTAEQVATIVRGMRQKLRTKVDVDRDNVNDSSIWALVRRVEERAMFASSINDDQLYAKRSIAGSYVPLTRDGEWQVRMQAYITDSSGKELPIKLRQGQQDSLFYGKVATEKDARELQEELDLLFDGEHSMRDINGNLQQVRLRAVASIAEQTPALVDILHYDEVMYSLSRLGIQLTPETREILVKKVTAQNTRARANLQRAGVAGWDKDVVRSASAFLEQQAYTAANKEFRHQFDEVLEDPRNWMGDLDNLNELKTKWENATGSAKEIAARDYFQEKYYYENAVMPDNQYVNKGNWYKERVKSLLDWRDSTGDIVHADDIWTNNEWSVAARTWAALAQLGGSIATGITQMISLPTNSWAYLASFNPKRGYGVGLGAGRAATLLMEYAMKSGNFRYANLEYIKSEIKSLQDSGKDKNKDGLTFAELSFLETMTEEQRLDAAQFNALTGTSRGRKITGNPTAQKFIQVWMFPFSYSEQFNRRVTLLAAYRGEYDRQVASGVAHNEADAAARAVASRAVDATQGDYAQYNRPAFFRGGLQSFVYMYKQYPIMMVQLLKNMNYEGRIIMLGSLILLSGVRGLPGADDILDIVDGIAQRLGLRVGSVEKEFARLIRETFGDELAGEINPIMMRGLLDHFTGWSFSNRLGLGDIIPGTGLLKPSATKQEILREVANIAGAPTAFLTGALEYVGGTLPAVVTGRKGMGALLSDSPVRAMANFGDSLKYYNTGAILDKKGYVVSQNVTGWEILGKALGWHPARAQMQMDWLMADSQEQAYMQMIKTEATRRAVSARLTGDREQENAVKAYIREWNETTKGTRLEIKNFGDSVSRAYREAKKPLGERALKASAKSGRAEAKEIMRLYGVDEEALRGVPD